MLTKMVIHPSRGIKGRPDTMAYNPTKHRTSDASSRQSSAIASAAK